MDIRLLATAAAALPLAACMSSETPAESIQPRATADR